MIELSSERSEDESSEASLASFILHDSDAYADDDEDYMEVVRHSSDADTGTSFESKKAASWGTTALGSATQHTLGLLSFPLFRFEDEPEISASNLPVVCFPGESGLVADTFPAFCFQQEPDVRDDPDISLADFALSQSSWEPEAKVLLSKHPEGLAGSDLRSSRSPELPPLNPQSFTYSGIYPLRGALRPSYLNQALSCWLDCALEILHYCTKSDFSDFLTRFTHAPENSPLKLLITSLSNRRQAEEKGVPEAALIELLSQQRDALRLALSAARPAVVKSSRSMENVFAWLADLLRNHMMDRSCDPIQLFFKAAHVSFRKCFMPSGSSGSVETRLLHSQHDTELHYRFFFQPNPGDYVRCGGHISQWVECLLAESNSHPISCWTSGNRACPGDTELTEYLVSAPVLLLIELGCERSASVCRDWNISQKITLARKVKGCEDVTYELCGRIFYHSTSRHWTTRVVERRSNFQHTILDYDGLQFGGRAREIIGATIQSHLVGTDESANIPVGSRTAYAVYYLNGGLNTQERFYAYRLEQLHKHHDISLSTPDLAALFSARAASSLPLSFILCDLVSQEKSKNPQFSDIFAVMDSARTAKGLVPDKDSDDDTSSFLTAPGAANIDAQPELDLNARYHKFLVAIGKDPGVPIDEEIKRPVTVECLVCNDATEPEALRSIQCCGCRRWNHRSCISKQFGLPKAGSKTWRCAHCDNLPLWDENDSLVGQYILYQRSPNEMLYPARVTRREGLNAMLVWYYGNAYRQGERKNRRPQELVPIHRLAAAAKYGRTPSKAVKSLIGRIKWPLCLAENAVDLGYTDETIVASLEDAFSSIVEILDGHHSHPIMQRYLADLDKLSLRTSEEISKWVVEHNIDILRGDNALAEDFASRLVRVLARRRNSESLASPTEIFRLVSGPGVVLLRLVILRVYLQRAPADDDEIFRIVTAAMDEERLHKQQTQKEESDSQSDLDSNDDFSLAEFFNNFDGDSVNSSTFRPTIRISRSLTEPEQAFAACNHWTDTTVWDGAVFNPLLLPEQFGNATGKITFDKKLSNRVTGPRAYVDVQEGLPTHVWPQSTSTGLSGGPPYSSYFGVFRQQIPVKSGHKDKPLPRPKPRSKPAATSTMSLRQSIHPFVADGQVAGNVVKTKRGRDAEDGSDDDVDAIFIRRRKNKRRVVDSD